MALLEEVKNIGVGDEVASTPPAPCVVTGFGERRLFSRLTVGGAEGSKAGLLPL